MKLPILASVLSVPVAFGAGWLVARDAPPTPGRAAEEPAALAPDGPSPAEKGLERLAGELERLAGRVEGVHRDVLGLRASVERRPLAPAEPAPGERAAAARVAAPAAAPLRPAGPDALPDATRETVLTILAEEEERRAEDRRAQRRERAANATLERARGLAQGLELGAGGEEALADLLSQQALRTRELRTSLEALPRDERKEAGKRAVEELTAWRTEQLNTRFEANAATELAQRMLGRGDAARVPDAVRGGESEARPRQRAKRDR